MPPLRRNLLCSPPPSEAGTRRLRACRGFSLLELACVTALVAITAAIALPRYADSLARYRVELACRRIIADLNLIRMRAWAQGTCESARFDPDAETMTLICDPDINFPSRNYIVHFNQAPYYADIVERDFSGRTFMYYNRYGQPCGGGYVVLRVGNVQRKVVVDGQTGKAVME